MLPETTKAMVLDRPGAKLVPAALKAVAKGGTDRDGDPPL